jgi:hypothetical protein
MLLSSVLVLPNHQHTLTMGTELVPETWEKLHTSQRGCLPEKILLYSRINVHIQPNGLNFVVPMISLDFLQGKESGFIVIHLDSLQSPQQLVVLPPSTTVHSHFLKQIVDISFVTISYPVTVHNPSNNGLYYHFP